jgi:hypothetical protein
MKRLALTGVVAACLALSAFAPAAIAGSQPAATMVAPNGCSSAVYAWANMRKAVAAHIEIRPNGVLIATVHSGPVGANGSFAMPASVTFVAGQHYTLLGYLTDSAGRSVQSSGAAWWGYC